VGQEIADRVGEVVLIECGRKNLCQDFVSTEFIGVPCVIQTVPGSVVFDTITDK
jgi:hypothetical protein